MSLTSPPVGQTPPLDQVKPLAKKESPLEVTKRILEEHGVTDFEVLDENNPNGQILIGEETLAICEATKRGQPIVLITMRRQFKDKTLSEKLELACKEIGSQGIEVIICTEAVERPYPTEAEIKVAGFLKELGFSVIHKDCLSVDPKSIKVGLETIGDKVVVKVEIPQEALGEKEVARLKEALEQ